MKIVLFALILAVTLPVAAQVTTEELDPYFDLVDSMVHRLDHHQTMTVRIVHLEANSDEPRMREKISFRYVNDSVLEQRFYDRLFGRRQYFLVRHGQTFDYDYRHSRVIHSSNITEKDSAGYHIVQDYSVEGRDTATFYQRTKTDSATHHSITFSRSSIEPNREYEYENFNDTLLIAREYKTSGGYRRLISEQRHRHIVHHAASIEDVYTITYYNQPNGDEQVTESWTTITHLQYDLQNRLTYAIRLNYRNGIQEKENSLRITYDE